MLRFPLWREWFILLCLAVTVGVGLLSVGQNKTDTVPAPLMAQGGGLCGNGMRDPGEPCDPTGTGNEVYCGPMVMCNQNCTCPPYCGDGVVTSPEECEPTITMCGNLALQCNNQCRCIPPEGGGSSAGGNPVCGNGIIEQGEQCEITTLCPNPQQQQCANCQCVAAGAGCGNGVVDPGEQCDGGPCCSGSCSFSPLIICRESTAGCDPAEQCTGNSAACPADINNCGMASSAPAASSQVSSAASSAAASSQVSSAPPSPFASSQPSSSVASSSVASSLPTSSQASSLQSSSRRSSIAWSSCPGVAPAITEYPLPLAPNGGPLRITAGPDGNLWFTEKQGNKIGRITPNGTIREFAASIDPADIVTAQDGNLWFTGNSGNKIGRITPSGSVTQYSLPSASWHPFAITASLPGLGYNGVGIFFTQRNGRKVGFADVAVNGTINNISDYTILPPGADILAMTIEPQSSGPYLWFTEYSNNTIGKLDWFSMITNFSSVEQHHYPVPTPRSGPTGITLGPDGNIWFTEDYGNKIGRIAQNGTITEYSIPTAQARPFGITAGPDGNLWFTEHLGNKIGRITPSGSVTEYPIPTANSGPDGITLGPDGNIWFTEYAKGKIGKLVICPASASGVSSSMSGGSSKSASSALKSSMGSSQSSGLSLCGNKRIDPGEDCEGNNVCCVQCRLLCCPA